MYICRQLLLIDQGQALDSKRLLEARWHHTLSSTASSSSSSHLGVDDDLRKEAIALGRCYVLDTLCGGLRDCDSATTWLAEQLERPTILSLPETSHVRMDLLPREEVERLMCEVEERRARRAPPRRRAGSTLDVHAGSILDAAKAAGDERGRPRGLGKKQSAASSSPVADFLPGDDVDRAECSFTMTGKLSDDGDGLAASVAPSRKVDLLDLADLTDVAPPDDGDGLAASVAPSRRQPAVDAAPSGRNPIHSDSKAEGLWPSQAMTSILRSLAICWSWFNSSFFNLARLLQRKSVVTEWRHRLGALVSCVMLFALVAESRSLGAIARQWWRRVRIALRTLIEEDLMSHSLTLSPPVKRVQLTPYREGS